MSQCRCLSLRNVFPSESFAGILYGYELAFVGPQGMGSIRQKEGAHMHGVVHVVTETEMAALDKIEGGYVKVELTIHLYGPKVSGGATRHALCYQTKGEVEKQFGGQNGPPSERYIDIISRGCQHYGVAPEWILWLRSQKVVPRAAVKDMKRIDLPANARTFTLKELAAFDGQEGRPFYFSINRKVVEAGKLPFISDYMQKQVGPKDCTLFLARGCYEPIYPIATTFAGMSEDHRSFIEDFALTMLSGRYECKGCLSEVPES